MKVIILSDTHMPKKARQLPAKLVDGLREADYILHAGDWQTEELYEVLYTYAPVDGVTGNVDANDICRRFGEKKIIEIGQYRIGITHGHIGKGATTENRAIRAFKGDRVDAIIFGHSHIPVLKKENDVILFNPGSPTDKRRQPQYSYGVMEVGDTLQFRHVFFDDKQ